MRRGILVGTHRYAGLVMTIFLVVAGLTGSVLVWRETLDRAAWPILREVVPARDTAPIDAFELRDRVLATIPGAVGNFLRLDAGAGEPVFFQLREPSGDDELYVDPYTGRELGRRRWGDISQGAKNLVPFLYRLHYSMALGTIGTYAFGIVALLWVLDCFVGAYLTMPRIGSAMLSGTRPGRGFFARWKPAWTIKRKRLNHDLHRAGGLWLWAMLFVLAWSSVGFNLREVYAPVSGTLLEYRDPWREIPDLPKPRLEPRLSFREAHRIGQALATSEADRHSFAVARENWLTYVETKGVYLYALTSNRDIRGDGGGTEIWFDGDTGALVRVILPSGQHSGNTVTNWLFGLHMAQVWGLPFRIFISFMGTGVAMLSMTGLIIWWRKRKARVKTRRRRATQRAQAHLAPHPHPAATRPPAESPAP